VTVILVNWHTEAMLTETLAALSLQTVPPVEVVVVDNGSRAPMPVECYRAGPIRVMSMPDNYGFARGNNRALASGLRGEWVALLNPDAIPAQDWLERLLAAAERHPDVAAFGSKQIMAETPDRLDGLGDVYHVSGAAWRDGYNLPDRDIPSTPCEIFSPCAAAAMYRRAALDEAGGFDEDYFCYFEDVDLGFRLRLLGHRCMLVPDAVVRHIGSAATGGQQSDFAVYHGHRNLVWTYFKCMPAPWLWLYLPQHMLFNLVTLVWFAMRGQGRVIARAKWHALRGLPGAWRKRRAIQATRRASWADMRAAMADGWLAPYRRKLGVLAQPDVNGPGSEFER
jgi:GT2 family glycosyltransferase